MHRGRMLATLTWVAFAGACSLFVDDTALSGTSPIDGDAGDSAASVVSDAADAVTTAPDVADAAPTASCSDDAGHAICENFDGVLSPIWIQDTQGGAELRLVGAPAISAPNALHGARSGPNDGGQPGRACLKAILPGHPTRVVCELDVRVDELSSAEGYLLVFTVALDDVANGSSAHYEADLVATTNGTYFLETSHRTDGGNSSAQTYSSVPLALGQWRHVRFALTRSTSPTVDVWMDGVVAIASLPIQPPATFERGELYVGGVWAVGPMTWSVHADNVVCDLSP